MHVFMFHMYMSASRLVLSFLSGSFWGFGVPYICGTFFLYFVLFSASSYCFLHQLDENKFAIQKK